MSSGSSGGFTLYRRTPQGLVRRCGRLAELFEDWAEGAERWLFISPHDDDVVMGAGLLLQKALADGVEIFVAITTDGRMGYCDLAQRGGIVGIRKSETIESFDLLGVRKVRWLGFPDCDLARYLGRRAATQGDPGIVEGFTGLQNAYVRTLRDVRPTRLFLATGNDLHPDHKLVYQEALISLFHAQGEIWPELGRPIEQMPPVYEMAIYCAFPGEPALKVEAGTGALERKLSAISAYRSQKQIELLVERLRKAGPTEYFRRSDFALYSPSAYEPLFT